MNPSNSTVTGLGEMELLRQRFLWQARTLLFTNPRLAAECREKALLLLHLRQEAQSRQRA